VGGYRERGGILSRKRLDRAALSAIAVLLAACCGLRSGGAESAAPTGVSPDLRRDARSVLGDVFRTTDGWKRVHAAEALIALDYDVDAVRECFEQELIRSGDMPRYRIGVRRVLIRMLRGPERRRRLESEIVAAFMDADGPDRVHAAETLAKLGYRPEKDVLAAFRTAAQREDALGVYSAWCLANADREAGLRRLAEFLESVDQGIRAAVAYALRHLAPLPPAVRRALFEAARREEKQTYAHCQLVCAACAAADSAGREEWKREVVRYARTGTPPQQWQALQTLAELGDPSDLPLLCGLLGAEAPDVRTGAALAILRIDRRRPRRLGALDWWVIVLYALGMIAVGVYYSGRARTRDDYLLGGRSMRPWAVGLSLFATLLSTITYLAIPGEMIKHGPMIISSILILPLVGVVVGWGLIPYFMRLPVTTAYEILEGRLGVSVRMLGSVFFLSLRLLWMAVIIYATTSKVLVPLLGLGEGAAPWVCAVLGLVTVVYTSMGGLRAVVFTDVVQTFILFAGALLAVALITVRLGGVDAWWPHAWDPTWDPPKVWFDPKARITVAGVCLSTFVWYICTAGSDQMAIQRYLATRDARSARRMYFTSLGANAAVTTFLAVLGFALFAYFRAAPHLIPDGHTVSTYADRLFTRFIVSGLPPGASGLVIAGLLAAAMSSLSSGVNSSSSVVTVDFVERFRRRAEREVDHVRLARWVSWFVGLVVVALSAVVQFVPGNLLEVTYKVVNLLVAPLFVLFFMALFVPWATTIGTWAGAGAATAAAIGIAFFRWFGLSFIWIMPGALATGAVVGTLVSLVPAGRRRRPPEADGVENGPRD